LWASFFGFDNPYLENRNEFTPFCFKAAGFPPRRPFLRHSLLTLTACIFLCAGLMAAPARAEIGEPEKEDLRFGFIKLTDMAPLAIAYKRAFSRTRACT